MKKSLLLLTFILVTYTISFCQYNVQFLGRKTYTAQNLSGSWGYTDTINNKEYALVGTTKGLSIVDITTPTNPVEVKFINGKQGTWRECQTYKNYAYITQDNDTTNSEGVLIYDLSQIPGGKVDTFKGNGTNNYIGRSHSLYIDEKGFLYLNGGDAKINGTRTNGVVIYDLKPNPKRPTYVGFTQNLFGTGAVNYVHDCYVRNDTMFQAHIYNNRFTVWDIRNRANPIKIQDFATPYSTIHNMWLSNDSKTLFVTHEQFNMPLEAYDISDLNNIRQIDEFKINPTNEEIAHNVHVIGDFAYVSYYSDGVAIFDISDPTNVITVAYYDTQPNTTRAYNGVWGAYGYYRSGNMTLSDMSQGLFVVKPTYKKAARIQGTVTDTNTHQELSGVKISFVDTANSVLTTIDGIYKTGSAKAGFTRFKAEKTGYQTKFFNATLVNGSTIIVNLELRQNPVYTTQNASFCEGRTYTLPDGRIVSSPGSYISDIVLPSGKDSIITTNLTQKSKSVLNVNASICQGNTYTLPKGTVVSNAGIYYDTLSNSIGCDSIITTNLSLKNKSFSNLNAAFCQGSSFTLPRGRVVTSAGIYNDTLINSLGCDSIITINLTQKNRSSATLNASFCQGSSYTLPKGRVVSSAGIYRDTLTNSIGCDSVITINLTQKNRSFATLNASFCEGSTYTLPKGRIVSSEGTYRDTLSNIQGCDSVITINLRLKNRSFSNLNASFCQGNSYTLPKGRVVTIAGIYKDTLTNTVGCDSIITINLSQKSQSQSGINASFCQGRSYILPKGRIVTQAGIYNDTLINTQGCDSIITVNLTQRNRSTATLNASFCQGTSYTLPKGRIVTTAGIYSDTLTNSIGCDSIISINLSSIASSASSNTVTICEGETYQLPNGTVVSVSGTYNNTTVNSEGCDSTITTNVQVKPEYIIEKSDSIYTGQTYTLPNGTTTSVPGTYTNTLTSAFGCDSIVTINLKVLDTSTVTGIKYNPSSNLFYFYIQNQELYTVNKSNSVVNELIMYNTAGAVLFAVVRPENIISLPVLPKGMYILRAILTNQEQYIQKLVIYD